MVTTLPPLKIVYATAWFGTKKFCKSSPRFFSFFCFFLNKINHGTVQDEQVGHDCPIPEGYTFNLTDAQNSWCTITSSTEETESAAGLMLHAPDTQLNNLPKRTFFFFFFF